MLDPDNHISSTTYCNLCGRGSMTDTCDVCNDILDSYVPPSPQVELDGEITLYESSLGYFPFKE